MNRSESGAALIIVLVISIISMSIALFTIGVSRNILFSSNMLMDKLYAKIGAESEIAKLKFYISTGQFHPTSVTNPAHIPDFPPILYINGTKQNLGKYAQIKLMDTGGLLDVWVSNAGRIERLLENEGVAASKAEIIRDSISDWYDKDNLKHLNGAEDYYYHSRGDSYGPRNFAGIQSIDELHLIRGLDNKTFSKIKPYLTLSPKWMMNINTMDAQLLSSAFNIPLNLAENLVKLRKLRGYISTLDIEQIAGIKIASELYSSFPTFILDVKLNFRHDTAMENPSLEISFRPNETTPYRILKWKS